MSKIRFILSLIITFLVRFKVIILLGVVFGFLVFIAGRVILPLLGGVETERIGLSGRYTSEKLPLFVLEKISQGLTKINTKGELQEGLAKSWETPDGGKTWIFHLGEHFWQDGKKVTSYSINYTFEDVSIEKPDEETIIFKLNSQFAPFPFVVSKPVFRKGLLGTGEYKVTSVSLAGNYVERIVMKNKANLKKVIKFYPNEERAKLAFKLGQVDKLIDLTDPKPLASWKNVEVNSQVNKTRIVALFYNTMDEFLSEKLLRQALSYAIKKDELTEEKEHFVRALGPISSLSWYFNPQIKPYDFDPKRAEELLKEAEVKMGKKVEKLNLVSTPPLLEVAEKIKRYWEELGISITVQVTSVMPSEYQAFLVMYDIPLDPDQYSIWHSQQHATNISRYKDPRIDKLLEDGRQEVDPDKRKKIYLDFQRFLLEDAPATFLFYPVSYTINRR